MYQNVRIQRLYTHLFLVVISHPIYVDLHLSCISVYAANDMFDMIIFHEGNDRIKTMNCAPNVKKIDVKRHGLAKLIASAIYDVSSDVKKDKNIKTLFKYLSTALDKFPYFLAEFKIAVC